MMLWLVIVSFGYEWLLKLDSVIEHFSLTILNMLKLERLLIQKDDQILYSEEKLDRV